jgi:flagellin-like hook-associated protein FlgL
MACQGLSTGEPYEIDGVTRITPLGHATGKVAFPYSPPDQSSPDLIFQALEAGTAGNSVGIRYTTSADTSLYPGREFQDSVTISYERDENAERDVVVVHLATKSLPSCPDADADREAYDQFKKLYPVYSCTSARAVTSTAGDVLEALVAKNLENPASALVWASMEFKDEGWDSTAKVGPTQGTVWLSGGNDSQKASDHGIALKFVPDGSALQRGDVFEAGVGWYNGDENNLDVNAMNSYRTTMNVTGDKLLGANGADDNVLDIIQRLNWGLSHSDSELVGKELPKLKAALEKITTMETNVGTRIIGNQFVLDNLEQNKYSSEKTLSEIEDADFTKLITDLKNSQLVYEAVLGTTGLTTKLSLLNYI